MKKKKKKKPQRTAYLVLCTSKTIAFICDRNIHAAQILIKGFPSYLIVKFLKRSQQRGDRQRATIYFFHVFHLFNLKDATLNLFHFRTRVVMYGTNGSRESGCALMTGCTVIPFSMHPFATTTPPTTATDCALRIKGYSLDKFPVRHRANA